MKGLNVGLSCLIGAFIGSFICLQVTQGFWWIGIIAGGTIGYIAYNPRQVLAAIFQSLKYIYHIIENMDWEKLGKLSRTLFNVLRAITQSLLLVFNLFIFIFSIGYLVFIYKTIFIYLVISANFDLENQFVAGTLLLAALLLAMYSLAATIFFVVKKLKIKVYVDGADIIGCIKDLFTLIIFFNPISMNVFAVWGLWRWRYKIISFFRNSSIFFLRLFRKFLVLTHSDIRLLCGIDAAIGSAVGYYFGNAFIGAAVGLVWGAINYYLISIKLLKLNIVSDKIAR